jgi:ATP-dependent Lon protease
MNNLDKDNKELKDNKFNNIDSDKSIVNEYKIVTRKRSNSDISDIKNSNNINNYSITSNSNNKKKYYNEINYKIIRRCKYDKYFSSLSKNKQIEVIEKEDDIYNFYNDEIPLRYRILFSNIDKSIKYFILQKIDYFESLSESDNEYSKLSRWIYGVSLIPFNKYVENPISLTNSVTEIKQFLNNTYEMLENTIYGQNRVKNKIIEIMAQWISNPESKTQVIALEGPPGVGKTSLIKNGVSKALKRPFSFYALGGASDISNLEGHSYTYEGAIWGRIVEMLMESKVMNPIIFFDELDKISNSPKGSEIDGLLIHMTDGTQNNTFHDKYFSGINIDLSRVLFFFSFNDIEKINPILRDRLTIIKFDTYSIEEKIIICKKYLIPEIMQNIGFNTNNLIVEIDDSIIEYIIYNYTSLNEDGVRGIKKILENIFLKINVLRFINNNNIKIDFPYFLTKDIVDILLNE